MSASRREPDLRRQRARTRASRPTRPTARMIRGSRRTTMRFMILVKATRDSEAGVMPEEKMLAEMGRFNEELVNAGVMQAGEGLHPSTKGARVRFSGKDRQVKMGPFGEPNDLVAGFW